MKVLVDHTGLFPSSFLHFPRTYKPNCPNRSRSWRRSKGQCGEQETTLSRLKVKLQKAQQGQESEQTKAYNMSDEFIRQLTALEDEQEVGNTVNPIGWCGQPGSFGQGQRHNSLADENSNRSLLRMECI